MQAFEISDVKGCMSHILLQDTFDDFLLQEATIQTKASFVIDGAYVDGYYTEEELSSMGEMPSFVPYGEVRSLCFSMIKGKKTPGYFKFVFLASPALIARILEEADASISAEDISSLALNVRFKDDALYITTGSSLRIFTVDRSIDFAWDSYVSKFLSDHSISFEKVV